MSDKHREAARSPKPERIAFLHALEQEHSGGSTLDWMLWRMEIDFYSGADCRIETEVHPWP